MTPSIFLLSYFAERQLFICIFITCSVIISLKTIGEQTVTKWLTNKVYA